MKTNTRSTRPVKVFLLDQVVENLSVLDAAIVGDLYYWIAKDLNPWRNADDYAKFFKVNEKTVRSRLQLLSDHHKYFKRRRTRMKSGYLGAYEYSACQNSNSVALKGIYKRLLEKCSSLSDFGKFDPEWSEVQEIPEFQVLTLSSIESCGDIKSAYLLCRLAWGQAVHEQGELCFRSIKHFEKWSNLGERTAQRHLEKLEAKGFATSSKVGSDFMVSVYQSNSDVLDIEDFLNNVQQNRFDSIMELTEG
ncbi:hypothetical protein [Marisediminitalea sp.]|uniref:hypothetical protein n=1 Tax=Marisediminitalea sp. TaxID=2662268 RepID=UPI003516EBBE